MTRGASSEVPVTNWGAVRSLLARLDELVRKTLASRNDPRTVLADPSARYFGAEIGEHTLTPGADATTFDTRLEDWAKAQAPA